MTERDGDFSEAGRILRNAAAELSHKFPELAEDLRVLTLRIDPPKFPEGTIVEVSAYVTKVKGIETFLAYYVNGEFYKEKYYNGTYYNHVDISSTYEITPYTKLENR